MNKLILILLFVSNSVHSALIDDYSNYQFGDLGYTDVHSRWSDAAFNQISPVQYKSTGQHPGSTLKYMRYDDDGSISQDWYYSNHSFLMFWDGLVRSVALDISSNYGDDYNIHGKQYHAWVTYGDGSAEDFLLPLEENPRITVVPWAVTSDIGIKSIHFGDEGGQARPQGFYSIGIDNLVVDPLATVPAPAVVWLFLTGLIVLMRLRA